MTDPGGAGVGHFIEWGIVAVWAQQAVFAPLSS
jgi:hypothetical protein